MTKLPGKLRKQLLKALGVRSQSDAEVDELNAFFLQVVFALLLIFMCAFFLFMGKVDGEISQIDNLKEELAKAEEAKILRALDEIAESYRIRYGLKEFLHVNPANGQKDYDFQGVIADGKFQTESFAARSFAEGAKHAAIDYADRAALILAWETELCSKAGDAVQKHPGFAAEQIASNVENLKNEIIEVQTLAAASMQEYLARHPELVRDEVIQALLRELSQERSPADRERLFGELNRELERYVYQNLKSMCGCEMLRERE